MQTILPPSGNTIKILGKARSAEHGLRWMTYVLAQPVEGGVLVFHTLTRALLLLTPEEYAAPDNLPELRDGWFRVPQEMDDMKYADQVRFIRRTMWKEPEHTTTYTIFTTTDCNARCFYSYEILFNVLVLNRRLLVIDQFYFLRNNIYRSHLVVLRQQRSNRKANIAP